MFAAFLCIFFILIVIVAACPPRKVPKILEPEDELRYRHARILEVYEKSEPLQLSSVGDWNEKIHPQRELGKTRTRKRTEK